MTIIDWKNKEFALNYARRQVNTSFKDLTLGSLVLGYLGDVKGKLLLDVGCGSGTFTKSLYDAGARVMG